MFQTEHQGRMGPRSEGGLLRLGGRAAAALFVVMTLLLAIVPMASAQSPYISVSPPSGNASESFVISGEGWSPDGPVTLTWSDGSVLASVTPNEAGEFGVSVVVPASAAVGSHTITAVDAVGEVDTRNFTVNAGGGDGDEDDEETTTTTEEATTTTIEATTTTTEETTTTTEAATTTTTEAATTTTTEATTTTAGASTTTTDAATTTTEAAGAASAATPGAGPAVSIASGAEVDSGSADLGAARSADGGLTSAAGPVEVAGAQVTRVVVEELPSPQPASQPSEMPPLEVTERVLSPEPVGGIRVDAFEVGRSQANPFAILVTVSYTDDSDQAGTVAFRVNGEPVTGEFPVMPGERRTYELQVWEVEEMMVALVPADTGGPIIASARVRGIGELADGSLSVIDRSVTLMVGAGFLVAVLVLLLASRLHGISGWRRVRIWWAGVLRRYRTRRLTRR